MKKCVDGIMIEMTAEEIAEMKHQQSLFEVEEFHRPLQKEEVIDLFMKQNIQSLRVNDNTAFKMKDYYPTFEECIGKTMKLGDKLTYNGELWKIRQDTLIISSNQFPSTDTASLYERIDEQHLGNEYDPIPYDVNMVVESGKVYSYKEALYRCIRNSEIPLYAEPEMMLGNYFEELIK